MIMSRAFGGEIVYSGPAATLQDSDVFTSYLGTG